MFAAYLPLAVKPGGTQSAYQFKRLGQVNPWLLFPPAKIREVFYFLYYFVHVHSNNGSNLQSSNWNTSSASCQRLALSCLSALSGNSNKFTSSGYNCPACSTFHCSFASPCDGPFDTFINGFVLCGINLHLSSFQDRGINAQFDTRSDPGCFPRRRSVCLVGWKAQRIMPRYSEFPSHLWSRESLFAQCFVLWPLGIKITKYK